MPIYYKIIIILEHSLTTDGVVVNTGVSIHKAAKRHSLVNKNHAHHTSISFSCHSSLEITESSWTNHFLTTNITLIKHLALFISTAGPREIPRSHLITYTVQWQPCRYSGYHVYGGQSIFNYKILSEHQLLLVVHVNNRTQHH